MSWWSKIRRRREAEEDFMKITPFLTLIIGLIVSSMVYGQSMSDQARLDRAKRLMAAQNPLPPSDSVWIEELTYMEVRDQIASGVTTAIIPTGGIEENGPYLATGKHNYILRAICPAIVHALGNALCAPIVQFVPEGDLDPPTNLSFIPGTFSVRDETFEALLDDIATSLKLHGFKDIVFLGDSGGNQRGMGKVVEKLNSRWAQSDVRAHFIREFYTPGWEDTETYTEEVLGVAESQNDGHHDDIWVTALMMVTDPSSVRYEQRMDKNLASINGIDISDLGEIVELGRKMAEYRARNAAEAIRERIN